jgi:peptidylprolyl isomerase
MPKGLIAEDLIVGSGPQARRGNIVHARGSIRLRGGDLLREFELAGLVLGLRRNFAGLERGLEGMQAGGRRRLTVPPHLGYRDGRSLVCEVELVSVNGVDTFERMR